MTLIYALLVFAFVASATPGPNNLMLLASGANFGFRRTLPHMFGISLGHSFMVAMIGLGLSQAFQTFPILHDILLVISIAYMLWLAWKIAHASAPKANTSEATPMTFWQAVAFQWVNPKAWIMGIGAQTNYAQGDHWTAAILVGACFLTVNFPAITLWAWLGQEMQRILTNPRRLSAFNWSMAILLVASLLPILFH